MNKIKIINNKYLNYRGYELQNTGYFSYYILQYHHSMICIDAGCSFMIAEFYFPSFACVLSCGTHTTHTIFLLSLTSLQLDCLSSVLFWMLSQALCIPFCAMTILDVGTSNYSTQHLYNVYNRTSASCAFHIGHKSLYSAIP